MTATLAVPTTVSEVLDAVANSLVTDGWAQGGYGYQGVTTENWKGESDCTCTFLAFARAIFGTNDVSDLPDDPFHEAAVLERRAKRYLLDYLGLEDVTEGYVWNDHRDRTLDEVLTALRGAADQARAEGL